MKPIVGNQENQQAEAPQARPTQEPQAPERKGSLWRTFDQRVERTVEVEESYSAGPHIDMRRYLEEPLIT